MDDFFTKAFELTQQGVAFATATVVRAEKPTSGKPGDRAIITSDGTLYGWIGGSCAQPTVIQEALNALAEDECRLIRLSTGAQSPREGVIDLPMTCFSGGTMEIYIEPQQPRPRLLIVGTLPVARSLAQLARAMNYYVIGLDLDGEPLPDAHDLVPSLADLGGFLTPSTFVVVATHGNYDEAALEHLLKKEVAYVGLVASRRRAESVRAYLNEQGYDESALAVLKAPAGLDIHARRGDEIALSIMAEIVQRRRAHERLDGEPAREVRRAKSEETAKTDAPAASAASESGSTRTSDSSAPSNARERTSGAKPNVSFRGDSGFSLRKLADAHDALTKALVGDMFAPAEFAIDPICKMQVKIETAKYHSVHEGADYYFCCAGCKRTFDAEPERYAAT